LDVLLDEARTGKRAKIEAGQLLECWSSEGVNQCSLQDLNHSGLLGSGGRSASQVVLLLRCVNILGLAQRLHNWGLG